MTTSIRKAVVIDGWVHRQWTDGVEQVFPGTLNHEDPPTVDLIIERVVPSETEWRIVDRTRHTGTYPPKVSGPFPTLDGAKAAWKILSA